MAKVGASLVRAVIGVLGSPPEPLYSESEGIDSNEESQLRRVFELHVRPYYDSFDAWSKKAISNSILYYVHSGEVAEPLGLDGMDFPFDPPGDDQWFCKCLADVLGVVGDDFDLSKYEYEFNVNYSHRLRRMKGTF